MCEDIMEKPSNLELSLLIMRLATAVFLLVWSIDKIVNQGHAQNVFKTFYFSTPSPEILTALGVVQTLIVVAFAAGFARFWTYGAVFLMHLVSTASTYARLINPVGVRSSAVILGGHSRACRYACAVLAAGTGSITVDRCRERKVISSPSRIPPIERKSRIRFARLPMNRRAKPSPRLEPLPVDHAPELGEHLAAVAKNLA